MARRVESGLTSIMSTSSGCVVGRSGAGASADPGGHSEVDEAGAEVSGVDPLGHRGVVVVGDEERQSEVAQDALGGAFPLGGVVSHLEQLAHEGKVIAVDGQVAAEVVAQGQALSGQVALAGLEAA